MAFQIMDSFDHYATADLPNQKWSQKVLTGAPGTITIVPGAGRRSSSALRVTYGTGGTAGSTGLRRFGSAPQGTCIFGIALRPEVAPVAVTGIVQLLDNASAEQLALCVHPDFRLAVRRGNHTGTELFLSASPILAIGTTTQVELKSVIGSAGSVELRKDGASLGVVNANTQATAGANFQNVNLGLFASNQPPGNLGMFYDDWYLFDGAGGAPWNAFAGDCSVDVRRPTKEGTVTEWAPNTGLDNALLVDDPTPDGATYVSAGAVGLPLTDTHVFEDAQLGGILGVQIVIDAMKTDAGVCELATMVRSGGALYAGPTYNPGTSYGMHVVLWATDPATGTLWTTGGFNSAEFGYRRTG